MLEEQNLLYHEQLIWGVVEEGRCDTTWVVRVGSERVSVLGRIIQASQL